jgi:hypothetical protein
MKNGQKKKSQRLARKKFLRQKRKNESKTDNLLAAADHSASVLHVRDRRGGRARSVRRG